MAYDDGKFGVIERQWFGLNVKAGGTGAAGYTFGTTDATVVTHVEQFKMRGPIKLKKFGAMVLATIGGGGTTFDRVPVRLRVTGANRTANLYLDDAAAPFSIASTTTFTNDLVPDGSYLDTRSGTPQTDGGTAANTATTTGSICYFVDYVRNFMDATNTVTSKWDR